MKYVVFEQEKTGLKMPVLFPDHIFDVIVKAQRNFKSKEEMKQMEINKIYNEDCLEASNK